MNVEPEALNRLIRTRIPHRPGDPQGDADANIASRSPTAENGGSCASFIAMPAWNGLVGPNALPTMAAPALIATTATASMRSPAPSSSRAGTSGMISSCMFSRAPIVAKNSETMESATAAARRTRRRAARRQPGACRGDRRRPTRRRRTHDADHVGRGDDPRGTATAANGPTGAGATGDRSGDDDAPARFRIVAPFVFTGGQDPGKSRGHRDGSAQQHDRMRKAESRGGIIGGSVSGMLVPPLAFSRVARMMHQRFRRFIAAAATVSAVVSVGAAGIAVVPVASCGRNRRRRKSTPRTSFRSMFGGKSTKRYAPSLSVTWTISRT